MKAACGHGSNGFLLSVHFFLTGIGIREGEAEGKIEIES